jgi:hypothetical protein
MAPVAAFRLAPSLLGAPTTVILTCRIPGECYIRFLKSATVLGSMEDHYEKKLDKLILRRNLNLVFALQA